MEFLIECFHTVVHYQITSAMHENFIDLFFNRFVILLPFLFVKNLNRKARIFLVNFFLKYFSSHLYFEWVSGFIVNNFRFFGIWQRDGYNSFETSAVMTYDAWCMRSSKRSYLSSRNKNQMTKTEESKSWKMKTKHPNLSLSHFDATRVTI